MSARAGEPAGPPAENAWFDRVYRAIPLATVFVALLALYAWEAARHSTPWLFTDELELSQISRSIEATGHGGRRGDPYFWQTLYTWLIAPAWAASSTSTAYEIVKYIGVIVMTLTVVPTYFLARTIVSRRAALFAAAGAAAVPALAYAPMILEEPLSYPYAALAFLAMALALARRTWFWIAAAIALSLLGGLVRGELGVLPVVLVLAAGLYAVTSDAGRRWRSRFTVWDWVGAIVLGAGAIIVFSGLVGKFSQSWAIATGNYRGRMLDYGLHAAGSLTIGLGLLPVVAALAALARPRDEERTPELRAFTSLFAAAVIGFGIYTAVKASYLSTVFGTTVQERNLIYLVPLVFVGTALWIDRPRLRWIPLAAAVGFVAYLIVATPYQLDNVPAVDSLGVAMAQMWNRNFSFAHGGIERGLIVALVIAVVLLVLPRFLTRRPGWTLAVTATAGVLVLAWGLTGQISAANYSADASDSLISNYPRPLTWLDAKTHGKPTLYLGQHLNSGTDLGVWLTEFWNRSLRYVWSVDGSAPGPGPTRTPNTHADGRLYPAARRRLRARRAGDRAGREDRRPSAGDRPLVPLQGRAAAAVRVQRDGDLRGRPDRMRSGAVPDGGQCLQPVLDAGAEARLCHRRRLAAQCLRGARSARRRPRDDRQARRGPRQAAAHRPGDGAGPALDAPDRVGAALRAADAEAALPRRGADRADVRAVELRRLRPAPARRPGRLRLLAQEGAADRDAATM